MSSSATAYDQLRYPGKFYPQTTPDRMAAMAILHGFQPARVDNCRVLELGCGEGANLVALAYALPNSRFEGVDLSASSIERARAHAAQVGITNVVFRAEDLAQFPSDRGEYDYIIAHGLYSWVPAPAREKMFEICSRHLSANGLAYLSYNALPGGYFRRYPRDIARFRIRSITDPAERVREARAVLTSLLEVLPENSVEATVIQTEINWNANSDGFLYHDLLADDSEPIYFLDFMDGASRHGLQFVAETELKHLFPPPLPEAVALQLERIRDRVEREQYMDFVRCRLFRQTVLCRAGCDLRFDPSPDRVRHLLIGAPTRPAVAIQNLHDSKELEFYTPFGARVTCNEPIPKALFWILGEVWPRNLTYDELKQEVFRRVGAEVDAESDLRVANGICRCYASGLIDLHYFQSLVCPDASERPVASAVARSWPDVNVAIPSLNLSAVAINENLISLLLLLDGTRDRPQLAKELGAQRGNEVPPAELERALLRIAECALLVA
jgi:SAM-dependent methyltransferase